LEPARHDSPKLRRLRVFNVVVTALVYCAQNAGRLFVVAFLPCLLEAASRLALEWLIYRDPSDMPALLVSHDFNPPTWLSAFATAPWVAMAWAFVLRDMNDQDTYRGLITARILRRARLRFELNRAILLAAAIFAADSLFAGLIKRVDREILFAVAQSYEFQLSNSVLAAWGWLSQLVQTFLVATVSAWLGVMAGRLLIQGGSGIVGAWRLMRGNRLRLGVIFFLLNIALMGLDHVLDPAKAWIVRSLTNPLSWTLTEATLRHVVDFPFGMLWIVTSAVTIGIVLDALEGARAQSGKTATPLPA